MTRFSTYGLYQMWYAYGRYFSVCQFKLKRMMALLFSITVCLILYSDIDQSTSYKSNKNRQLLDIKPGKIQMEPSVIMNMSSITQTHDNYKKSEGNFFTGGWHKVAEILQRTENCDEYFTNVPVFALNKDIIKYEQDNLKPQFSLAFSHMLHTQLAIYEVFLAMYFRPNNFYCIHVDYKASDVMRKTVESLVNCYAKITTTGKIFVLDRQDSIKVNT